MIPVFVHQIKQEIDANLTIALFIENIFGKTVNFFKILRCNLKYIIIFIRFTYQAIDLRIGFLKYETVVNIKTGSEYKILPAISFCVTANDNYLKSIRIKNRLKLWRICYKDPFLLLHSLY